MNQAQKISKSREKLRKTPRQLRAKGAAATWGRKIAITPSMLALYRQDPKLFRTLFGKLGQALAASGRWAPRDLFLRVRPGSATPVVVVSGKAAQTDESAAVVDADFEEALSQARNRGKALVAEILARPEMLSAADFAERVGTSRQAVNDKRKRHEVLGVKGATRGFRYPEWQLDEHGQPFLSATLPQLFQRLIDAWAVFRFLTQTHPELDSTAIEALKRGRAAPVVAAAENVAAGNLS